MCQHGSRVAEVREKQWSASWKQRNLIGYGWHKKIGFKLRGYGDAGAPYFKENSFFLFVVR